MSTDDDFLAAADRLAAILHNHPKAQYLRLTRSEAEAIAAAGEAMERERRQ